MSAHPGDIKLRTENMKVVDLVGVRCMCCVRAERVPTFEISARTIAAMDACWRQARIDKLIEEGRGPTSRQPLARRSQSDRGCLLYTSPSPRDVEESRMPSSA